MDDSWLQIEAFKRAIADAGLRKDQVDGLLTEPDWGDGRTITSRSAQATGNPLAPQQTAVAQPG